MAQLEKEKQPVKINADQDQYLVYPERRGEESDEKINPFSIV